MIVRYKALVSIVIEEEIERGDVIYKPKETFDDGICELLKDELPEGTVIKIDSHYWENVSE